MRKPAAMSALLQIERLSFAAALVASPLRMRLVLARRPVGTIYGDYTDFLLFLSDGLMLLLLAAWALRLRLERRVPDVSPKGFFWLLGAFTLIAGASAAVSVDGALSVYHFVRLAVLLGFCAWVADSRLRPEGIAGPVALMVGLQAVVGLQQFLSGADTGLQALGEYELDPAWPGVSIVAQGGERWLRAYGLSDHPNILGGVLAFGTLLLLARTVQARGFDAVVFGIAAAGGMAGLLATFSRSAWLGFAASQVFLAAGLAAAGRLDLFRRQALILLLALILASPLVARSPALFASRLGLYESFDAVPQEVQSLGERALLSEAANEMFLNSPMLGVGLGASPQALALLRPLLSTYYQPPHNVALAAAAETGLFGAVAYALLLLWPWLYAYRRVKTSTGAAAVYALLLAASVIGFFDYYTWLLSPGRFWQYLIWGLTAVQIGHPEVDADE